jgi:hypothetical protein
MSELTMQVPTPDGGSVTATLPTRTCQLPDGRTGYYQLGASKDGCLARGGETINLVTTGCVADHLL